MHRGSEISANFATKLDTKQRNMERILSKREYQFIEEFIALIKKYNLFFSTNDKGEIELSVCDGKYTSMSDFLYPPIQLGDGFDETELYEIKKLTDKRIIQIAKDYLPEDLIAKHLKQPNSEQKS